MILSVPAGTGTLRMTREKSQDRKKNRLKVGHDQNAPVAIRGCYPPQGVKHGGDGKPQQFPERKMPLFEIRDDSTEGEKDGDAESKAEDRERDGEQQRRGFDAVELRVAAEPQLGG